MAVRFKMFEFKALDCRDAGVRATQGAVAEIAANSPAIRKICNAEVGHLALSASSHDNQRFLRSRKT
jgi:hypothetical protein